MPPAEPPWIAMLPSEVYPSATRNSAHATKSSKLFFLLI
eukprot:CAMPEP_0169471592 /NCGR_PEP_ID=MMETSP1042-20121227/24681_1 /TAXON_ID=464988 /ORGANISM="Hemiselmis andersenii, Strain CCMP1180" /LENGTH=38 /DNA_ID= /DNA_START= /DNA_END= /DNA_ORIENTATION=